MLKDVVLAPANGRQARRAVIIVHGLGDSAQGIIGLGEAFASALPDTMFLAPDAPFACAYSPFGYQWFDAESWTNDSALRGVKNAAPYLNDYIDTVLETRGLAPENVALCGFSQGTMMSLYVGPRRERPLAGILGYSGALVGGDELKGERKSSPPVMLIHGTADEVVPFRFMELAVAGLQDVNMNVQTVVCPGLGHSVDDFGLHAGASFLRACFKL